MDMQLGVTLGFVTLTAAVLMRVYVLGLRRPIDVGVVSQSWLAEQKLGKRDTGWQ
jgi:hypothetical protein